MNYGQLIDVVKAAADSKCNIVGLNKYVGEPITPEEVMAKVKEVIIVRKS